MLSRAIVLVVVFGVAQVTYADRVFVALSGLATEAYNAHVRVNAFPGGDDQFAMSVAINNGDSSVVVRDALVAEFGGSVNVTTTLRRITLDGKPGFLVSSVGDIVVGVFGTSNFWLEPGVPTIIGGITFTANIVDDLQFVLLTIPLSSPLSVPSASERWRYLFLAWGRLC